MCKIDFLGSGVCASGTQHHYVSYHPEGRMDLYAALAEGKISVTEQAVEIATTCDLCGKCDVQCYFVTEMRPSRVMEGAARGTVPALLRHRRPSRHQERVGIRDRWAPVKAAYRVSVAEPAALVCANTREAASDDG